MADAPTLQEFNAGESGRSFVVFDQTVQEYWKDDGFTKSASEAQVFNGGFETQEQLDAAWKHGGRIDYVQ